MLNACHKNILDSDLDDLVKSGAIYLSNYPACFIGNEGQWHQVRYSVANHFSVDISSIKLAGSGHLGKSAFKKKAYDAKESDLDLAIVSSSLFSKYLSWVISTTKSFTDTSQFPRQRNGQSGVESFKSYVSKRGMIRPDLLPAGKFKSEWTDFFSELSAECKDICKGISAAIYLSEECFIQKQLPTISELRGK